MLVKFQNEHPTDTEKLMFQYAGLYRAASSNPDAYRYCVVHHNLSEGFPYLFSVDADAVEQESSIVFDKLSETVWISGKAMYDLDILTLLCKRAEELGFERVITK